ncbi:MAG: hypothetical protein V3W37_09380, partial [Candidatus Binatia bacterium]
MRITRFILAILAALIGSLLAAPAVLIGAPFWAVAFFTSVVARALEPRHVHEHELFQFDPTIGWKPKTNLDVYHLTSVAPDVFHVITDSHGWPGRTSIAECEVLVFGDSFAFGYGVDAEASFAAVNTDLRI